MIIQVDTPEYADIFAAVYNSANTLFESSEQYAAAGQLFLPQLENDENFAYFEEKEIVGFMSFHCYEQYSELTSLYVRREVQNHGIGGQLMRHFEQRINVSTPWAMRFYEKPWEKILYKSPMPEHTGL
ncbi:MAG: GNAT family N-acetyltransferase [Butyrivibrio sp.]|nr:GNAT family N-acetyltransferase [Acetatifactor muris]MCM1558678.1 GNAT family N-acetyltransferase [Butyrivibrio sp.]